MSSLVEWFSNSGHTAFAAFAIALASLCVSVIAHWRTSTLQRRVVAIEETREHDRIIEQRKARLVAELVREPLRVNEQLVRLVLEIKNHGKAPADDITVELDGKPWSECPRLSKQTPLKRLEPKSVHRFVLIDEQMETHGTQGLPQQVRIKWRDQSGEPGCYETTLT